LGVGSNSLAVWDLIGNSVSWQTITPLRIDKVVSHRKEATFAVFHSSDPGRDGEEHHTKVAIFRVSSSVPILVRHIPFGLRNVILVPFQKHLGYNLVGITDTWKVVMIGDSEPTFKDQSLAASGINYDVQAPRKTLFHDIFGAAAFATSSTETLHISHPPGKGKGIHELFRDPVYLSPSLDILFDTVATTFLTRRPSETIGSVEKPGDLIEEDSEMDHEADIVGIHAPRVPTSGEMDIFTKLFRAHCLIDIPPSVPAAKANPKLNGIHTKEINRSPRRHKIAELPFTKTVTAESIKSDFVGLPVDETSSAISLVNGKKRKKTTS